MAKYNVEGLARFDGGGTITVEVTVAADSEEDAKELVLQTLADELGVERAETSYDITATVSFEVRLEFDDEDGSYEDEDDLREAVQNGDFDIFEYTYTDVREFPYEVTDVTVDEA